LLVVITDPGDLERLRVLSHRKAALRRLIVRAAMVRAARLSPPPGAFRLGCSSAAGAGVIEAHPSGPPTE
jgi:hypothetical protein